MVSRVLASQGLSQRIKSEFKTIKNQKYKYSNVTIFQLKLHQLIIRLGHGQEYKDA